MDNLFLSYYESPLGTMELLADSQSVVWVAFKDDETRLSKRFKKVNIIKETKAVHNSLQKELLEYFEGELRYFKTPMTMHGTPFQQEVWKTLLTIPYGETITYSEQAKLLGNLKAIRAIASANGRNPLSIIVPCHRIIGKNGGLTGYAGGLYRKAFLIKLEASHYSKVYQTRINFLND